MAGVVARSAGLTWYRRCDGLSAGAPRSSLGSWHRVAFPHQIGEGIQRPTEELSGAPSLIRSA